ncbi:MAG TPA: ABC transporter ATP-binding protein [Solirubrobacteraceae bacterium]|jgi:oligopeptide/dipeptide ABC transporter ATP-binding protein|nr:ABC transporter ATP-binding protein [Solirubrobacteraceae bacterium]
MRLPWNIMQREAQPRASEPAARVEERSEFALSVRNLSTVFEDGSKTVHAVRDVSFDMRPTERLGVVGESGSGKSALALSILGLIEPPGKVLGGEILLDGRDIAKLSDRQLSAVRGKDIALVLQDPMSALDPVKTIGSQIVEAVVAHEPQLRRSAARKRAAELLREVDIPQAERRLDDYPHQYSGGMRQRVAIAIAIANNPRVLIADEPTTALDVTTQSQVLGLLDRLVEQHRTAVILITHNLGVVSDFCDSVAVMYAGRFVETSGVDHVFLNPTHPYSEALLKCVPNPERLAEGPLPAITGFPPDLAQLPGGCSFAPRCPVGREVAQCHEQAPRPHHVATASGPAEVECHFAEQRSAQVKV